MRIGWGVAALIIGMAVAAWSQSISSTFAITDRGAISLITDGTGSLNAGYARILADAGKTTPSGVAIFSFRNGNGLVSEAGVPSSPLLTSGRVYAEINGPFNIGLAIANPGSSAARIDFFYTTTVGTDVNFGNFILPANGQIARFLNEAPFNSGPSFQGTFTFTSDVPVSVIALQSLINEGGDPLFTTLPVIDTSAQVSSSAAVLPHFADGDGWSTAVLLVNPTDTVMNGTIRFRAQNGQVTSVIANGQTNSNFNYVVAARSSFKLTTAGAGTLRAGSITVDPASGNDVPVPLVVFTNKPGPATVSQAGIPTNSGTAFRMYVEASGASGAVGSVSTGIAVANGSTSPATITFELSTANGVSAAPSKSFDIAPSGQMAIFINEIFPSVVLPFQGVVRISSNSLPISVAGLRGHYNERQNFLITTTPPTNEASPVTTAEFDFPHIVNGAGFSTQFVLFSGTLNQSSTGNLRFVNQAGDAYPLTIRSLISDNTVPVTLDSIVPASAPRGGVVTLSGSGFELLPSNNTVVVTTATGSAQVIPSTSTSTSLTVTVPDSAITGPVTVRSRGRTSPPKILEVTSSLTGLLRNPVTVNTATTSADTNIYVPTPTAGLSVTQIGIGDIGSGITVRASSAEIARGQTRDIVLGGPGLNQAASLTITVSGSGVVISNIGFQSGFVTARIAVDSTATTGPRNVIVTNATMDTSIMTGGLFIR